MECYAFWALNELYFRFGYLIKPTHTVEFFLRQAKRECIWKLCNKPASTRVSLVIKASKSYELTVSTEKYIICQ